VLHRARLQSMPLDWQRELALLLEELNAAYHGQPQADFTVTAVDYLQLSALSPGQLAQARITGVDEGPDGFPATPGRTGP
jgi:hypothetical protein